MGRGGWGAVRGDAGWRDSLGLYGATLQRILDFALLNGFGWIVYDNDAEVNVNLLQCHLFDLKGNDPSLDFRSGPLHRMGPLNDGVFSHCFLLIWRQFARCVPHSVMGRGVGPQGRPCGLLRTLRARWAERR